MPRRRPERFSLDFSFVLRWATVAALVIAGIRALLFYLAIPDPASSVGVDFNIYTDAARTWLTTGQFYPARELAGSYQVLGMGEILYPPIMLWLLVPFTVLPFALWIAIPIALTAWAIARMRPAPWAVAVIAALCVTDAVQSPFFWGTPFIWLLPAMAWALASGYPAALILMKPMFAPLVLPALLHWRQVVIGAAVLAVLAVPFGSLWVDWITAIYDSDATLTYGLWQVVPFSIPLIAWLGTLDMKKRPAPKDRPLAVAAEPAP